MGKIGRFDYSIHPRDVDFSKKATLIALGDYVLHTAGLNADENGFGMKQLSSQNYAWVLSRLAMEIQHYPEQYDKITIETWIEEVSRLMTTRNFTLYNAVGEPIGGACTQWAMIDFTTRRPVDFRTILDYEPFINPQPGIITKPIRVLPFTGEPCGEHTVAYSDIDFNRHTNSMKYLQWMLDSFPLERFVNQHLHRFDINFLHEALYGTLIEINQQNSKNRTAFELKNHEKTIICRAQFDWI